MKKMIQFSKMLTVVIFLLLASCKKDKDSAQDTGPLTAAELTDYYIAGLLENDTDPSSLICIRFEKQGSSVQAVISYNRSKEITIPAITLDQNRLSLDFSGGYNESVYTFELIRKNGGLAISSAAFSGIFPFYIPFSVITKKSTAAAFAGKIFRQTDTNKSFLKFDASGKWGWGAAAGAVELLHSYNNVGSPVFGWTGSNHLGVMMPSWKTIQGPVMVVQNANNEIVVFKEQN